MGIEFECKTCGHVMKFNPRGKNKKGKRFTNEKRPKKGKREYCPKCGTKRMFYPRKVDTEPLQCETVASMG